MTTPVQNTSPNASLSTMQAASAQAAGAASTTSTSDQFLKMLVAQLKNQDPLNPMDNAQVTSQMAQLSTVDGINKLNTTLSTLSMGFNATQSLQAASLVGSQVLVDGSSLQLTGGQASGGYSLDGAADGVTVTVKSASGEVVYTGQLGAQPAGMSLFNWDGTATNGAKAVDGTYNIAVTATLGGASVAASPLTLGRVDGVTPTATGTTLTLGGIGQVPLASVKQIL
jgi:flagellar basal-body rod modification protein FlgD